MKYLVLLIIMALSGAAGWYGGSWRGRDAIQALEKAQAMAKEAVAERDKREGELKQTLAQRTAEYQQGQAQRDADHAKVRGDLTAALAGRDKTIADLGRARDSRQAEIARLKAQSEQVGTTPEEKLRLQAEIDRLKRDVADKETQIAGFECSKVPVPEKLLTPLQGS